MKNIIWTLPIVLAGCGWLGLGKSQEAVADEAPRPPVAGPVCGNEALRGEEIGTVEGPGACGIENAVRLLEVGGLTLSQPARINCKTANSLLTWVEGTVKPTFAGKGGGADGLRVAASYACRTRNHRAGARLSEHSFGNAIDISGVLLRDGTLLTVLDDWSGSEYSSEMHELHSKACGPFGTVLGPRSDGYHADHFHFDVADYRSGPYCR